MGTISVNKLGGLSLALGPVIALVGYFLQPGGMLIDAADPADAQAVIGAMLGNAGLQHLTGFMIAIGLVMMLYGFHALQGVVHEGGNGHALISVGDEDAPLLNIVAGGAGFTALEG